MKQLLIVNHSVSENTTRLFKAIETGAYLIEADSVDIVFRSAFDVTAEDVKAANAIILATTENFGYMSGALKDFFDRIYYPCLDDTQALPFSIVVRAGNDGLGAKQSIEKIATGLRWKMAQPPLICAGDWSESFIEQAQEMGGFFAIGLEQGII